MFPSFKFLGEVVYTYPLIMGIAWGIAYHFAKNLNKEIKLKSFQLFFWGLFLTSWVGAKVFFILTSEYINTTDLVVNKNFWLGGGFVFYGGATFGFLFVFIHKFITKQRFQSYLFAIPVLALGHSIGRVGCFFAGCCYGVLLPDHYHLHRFPTQLTEALFLGVLSFILFKRLRLKKEVFFTYLLSYSVFRFLIEFVRADIVRGEYLGLSTSQLISIVIILIIGMIWIQKKVKFNT